MELASPIPPSGFRWEKAQEPGAVEHEWSARTTAARVALGRGGVE